MDPISRDRRIKAIYREIASLTKPCCDGAAGKDSCKRIEGYESTRCCDAHWCTFATVWANRVWNKGLVAARDPVSPDVPYLSKTQGCVVDPHLRPICTVHACVISSFGAFHDEARNTKYWTLREELDQLEWLRAEAKGIDIINLMVQLGGNDGR